MGLTLGSAKIPAKRTITTFHAGLGWLAQVAMFLTLGLLVFPRQVLPVMGTGLLISVVLIVVARPAAVFLSLAPFRNMTWRQKTFLSWVGLRGAVPIVFATYPLIAGLEHAGLIFNVVFFAVLTSVLLQGSTLPLAARLLRVERREGFRQESALDVELSRELTGTLIGLSVPAGSAAEDQLIVDLHFPKGAQIVLVERGGRFIAPDGITEIEAGDRLLVMASKPERLNDLVKRLGLERSTIPALRTPDPSP